METSVSNNKSAFMITRALVILLGIVALVWTGYVLGFLVFFFAFFAIIGSLGTTRRRHILQQGSASCTSLGDIAPWHPGPHHRCGDGCSTSLYVLSHHLLHRGLVSSHRHCGLHLRLHTGQGRQFATGSGALGNHLGSLRSAGSLQPAHPHSSASGAGARNLCHSHRSLGSWLRYDEQI